MNNLLQAYLVGSLVMVGCLLTGCATAPRDYALEESVEELFELFVLEAGYHGRMPHVNHIQFVFVDIKKPAVGKCYADGIITLDYTFWAENPARREVLLFHELGHCALLQTHRENSLMSTNLIYDYQLKRAAYLEEFFDHGIDWSSHFGLIFRDEDPGGCYGMER